MFNVENRAHPVLDHLNRLAFLTFLQESYHPTGRVYTELPDVIAEDCILGAFATAQPSSAGDEASSQPVLCWAECKRSLPYCQHEGEEFGSFSSTDITTTTALADFRTRVLWKLSVGYTIIVRRPVPGQHVRLTRDSEPMIDLKKRTVEVFGFRLSRPIGAVHTVRPQLATVLKVNG
ncbi:hypothetical protein KA517_00055 [Candidatus Gracilibacteria bacterium]|jgi:hypothetical protein|nr:hypothetical protein [Candidatus Gracilibacteria bacterium]